MTRISDLGFQQLLLAGFQRAQDGATQRQIQLAMGKVADVYSGLDGRAGQLLSAEGLMTRASAYEKASETALSRLQTQEAGMTTVADMAALMRQRFVAALASGSGDTIMAEVETAAQRIIGALNTEFGGVYVFGGVDGATPPLNATTLSDFGAATDTDALFSSAGRSRLPIEAGTTIDGGATALEIAGDLAAELKELANAASALGPFDGPLTAAQRDFLVQKVQRLDEISSALNEQLGMNGVAQSQAEAARIRNRDQKDFAEVTASGIEDADLAEVVARLSQDKIAVEASARALAQATQLSLLNFL
jgi:flagellar hook-associated protein 3 FlgL